jgi:hypothetical protein
MDTLRFSVLQTKLPSRALVRARSESEVYAKESTMMPLPHQECRWGILSTAGIARKNWRAIAKSHIGRVAAVASRDVVAA